MAASNTVAQSKLGWDSTMPSRRWQSMRRILLTSIAFQRAVFADRPGYLGEGFGGTDTASGPRTPA